MNIILLPATNGYPLQLDVITDANQRATEMLIHYGGNVKATFMLATPFDVPDVLLNKTGEVWSLKTLAEIRKDILQEGQTLEDRWRDVVTKLSAIELQLDASQRFVGADLFPGAVEVKGHANFNLFACLSATKENPLRCAGYVAFRGNFSANIKGKAATLTLAWRIDFSAQSAGLSFAVPAFGVTVPQFAFPELDWSQINIANFTPAFQLSALPGIPVNITSEATCAITYSDAFGLNVDLAITGAKISALGSTPIVLGDFTLNFSNGKLSVTNGLTESVVLMTTEDYRVSPLDSLTLMLHRGVALNLQLEVQNGHAEWAGCLSGDVSVFPTLNPDKRLTLTLALPFQQGQFRQQVNAGGLSWTREILLQPANEAIESFIEYMSSINSVAFSLRLSAQLLVAAGSLVDILGNVLAGVVRGVNGIAQLLLPLLEKLTALVDAAEKAEILMVLDATEGHLQQLVVQLRHATPAGDFAIEANGFELSGPNSGDLALFVDLRDGASAAYIVLTPRTPDTSAELLTLGSDLWFASADTVRPTGDATLGDKPPTRLLMVNVKAKNNNRISLVPFGLRNGQATFMQVLDRPLPVLDSANFAWDDFSLVPLEKLADATLKLPAKDELDKRLLPFLAAPATAVNEMNAALKQYIEIREIGAGSPIVLSGGKFKIPLQIAINLLKSTVDSTTLLSLDVRSMTASLEGGLIYLDLPDTFTLLGMAVTFQDKDSGARVHEKQMVLDLRTNDPRLYFADNVRATLAFTSLQTDRNEKPLTFICSEFVVHSGGLNLTAALDGRTTIRLEGLETNFTFDKATLQVNNGRIETFRLRANGKLPPKLLGDVDAELELDFGDTGQGLDMLDGRLKLATESVRCEQTHFEFRLESLWLHAFRQDDRLCFCVFLTGSAFFKPTVTELADGMFSQLANVEIRFTDCPISGDSDAVRRELARLNTSYVVALDQPVQSSLFDTFFFEIRSIGFEPRCHMFDDLPFALVIGGQIRFAEQGDVVRAECDFHKLYIAGGTEGLLPRIRCEGLGLSLCLGSALEIEGKVVAVDGRMPASVLVSSKPEVDIQANGFLGQGRVAIPGLPPFAASFGFVEIRAKKSQEVRRAWFVYLEAQRISYYFPLGPVPFYLREAGLGLGYHFTYVGIKEIDAAPNLPAVIKVLDTIAKSALEPAKLTTWEIAEEGDLTLVARAMFSMSSANPPQDHFTWNKEEEEKLPNLLLMNAVLAMRKSTFMMTANAWLGYSYFDWDKNRNIGGNSLAGKQTLIGYVVLAGERNEFLARLVSNPGAEIGPRLSLPPQFKESLKNIQYDATLYMRPGLLHFELGWPNHIRWKTTIAGVNIAVAGGAIFRVHDGVLLVGMNLEGQLSFDLSGSLNAGVVGISVSASVRAALLARIIGYLDPLNAASSLYYSLFSLQVRVEFCVSAWLEIGALFCKVTLRASLSVSLQIDVVAELALQGDAQMGSRMRASIAVAVFGRTLGLSVGLSLSPGIVDRAAARVGRFMDLGLVQDTPSSVAAIDRQDADNQKAAELGEARSEARTKAEKSPEYLRPANTWGAERYLINKTQFNAVLSWPKVSPIDEIKDIQNWVYITFLPAESFAAGTSSFYCAPPTDNNQPNVKDHKISLSGLPAEWLVKKIYLYTNKAWTEFTPGPSFEKETSINWLARQPMETETGENHFATLEEMVGSAFLGNSSGYREPTVRSQPERKTQTASLQEQYHGQELGYLGAITQDPADRRCHEARDYLLHKFAADLFDLTTTGSIPEDDVHVAHMGLTLLVPLDVADDEAIAAFEKIQMTIGKRIDGATTAYADSTRCQFFNPPRLRYATAPPAMVNTSIKVEGKTVKLAWALQWASEVEARAEDYLRHHRIVRTLTVGNSEYVSEPMIVISALHEVCEKDVSGTNIRYHTASNTRFTDDFADLPVAVKNVMFSPDSGAVVRYAVTPVCQSDTDGLVCTDFVSVISGEYRFPRLKKAEATLTLNPDESKIAGTYSLDIELLADVDPTVRQQNLPKGMSLWWRIVARSEAILPSGQYGSDAQSRRSLVSSLGAGQDARPGDDIFFVRQDPEQEWRFLRAENLARPDGLDGLDALIRDLDNPRSWTLYAQLVLRKESDLNDNVVFAGPLAPLKHAVKIMPAAQVFPVSALEYVRKPFASDSAVMQPVAAEDLLIDSGRAALPEPTLDPDRITLNLHPEFGAASSLSWNIRPSDQTVNRKRFRLRSGFTLWSITLDNGQVSWKTAKRHSEVRLLDEARVKVTPGEIGEPANWKMRYPSQAWRRANGNAPWVSQDNAIICWPTFPIRKHLLPEPSSELIRALLSHDKPDVIELKMVHPDSIIQQTKWTFSIQNEKRIELAEGKIALKGMTAAVLRDTLRELTAEPIETDSSQWSCEQRSGWILELQPINKSVSVQPEPERIALDFGKDLHPALEYLLTQMRRPEGKGALFVLDKRPVPVVNAEQLGTFLSVTGDAADPYGWAALDRLGLGVTVRLFDSNENQFLAPEYLYKQVKQGLEATKKVYPEFARNLCVERLLQPGTMTQCVPFTLRADRTGTFSHEGTDATLLPPSLVIVRLSVRPAISSSVGPWQPAQVPWRVFWVAFRNAFQLPLVDKKESPADLQKEDFENYGEQWAKWNNRYFTYSILNNHSGDLFALGAIEQTQPVRVAADQCGRISVTLPEADGWAHQRAYAVVPQWRYAEMLGLISDEAPSLGDIRNVAIIERTAPVMPQTVYALERIGDKQWGLKDGVLVKREAGDSLIPVGRIPGKDMAFVLPLHPEQILNEDNVPLKHTLSRTGLLWQLGLHNVDPEWCGEYQHMSARTDITSSELKEGELLAMLNAKVAEGHTFARSKIRLVTNLPHWYRHTVHAAASAGLSVSPASAIYLPEAYASLVTVDDDGLAVLTPNHPWEKLLSTMPQITPEEGPLKMARYRVSWPLLRYHDTTDEITANLWDDPLSELPDPQVCYDLELRTAASGLHPQSTVRPLARIFRAPDSRPDNRRFQLLLQNRLWEMNCEIVGKDLEVLFSPLSEPIALTDSLRSALGVSDSLYRVPGGWSLDWLDEIVQKFTDDASRLALMADLWKALADASRGLPEAPELEYFQKYELHTLTITRPATDADRLPLKQRMDQWLSRLAANSGKLDDQLAAALRQQLVPIFKEQWPWGEEYSITVPWISGFPLPDEPETLQRVPGSPSRHLVPELMTQTQYEAAMKTADSNGKARLTALRQAQKTRIWGGGELIIRATRGDAIPLELAPVKPL
ncbi:hypothetical protein [Citrobacter sp. Marseille-Q6884]|uniref:hypothetical protein n=1 Tax=Citrobacter sp. Marseille-Q6884 TaxID=2956786 RepID=UPI0021B38F94|nr:hypothetical protein [Citrobacter sp. Marseille-Q6884]